MKSRETKWSWAVVVVVAAVFGLSLAGCDDGGSGKIVPDLSAGEDSVDVQPAPAAGIPPELMERLTALEETLSEKMAEAAPKDEELRALEAQIEGLDKELKEREEELSKAGEEAKKREEEAATAEKEREGMVAARDAVDAARDQMKDLERKLKENLTFGSSSNTGEARQSTKTNVGDELLKDADVVVKFTEIDSVDESPSKKALRKEDQWLCLILFKEKKKINVPDECDDNECYNGVMSSVVKSADARACYHVEGCWDEDNDGAGDDGIPNDINRCSGKRKLWVKEPETTKLSDIKHAHVLAHDTEGDDFNFEIEVIKIFTKSTIAYLGYNIGESVDHQFLYLGLGNVNWTKR